LPAKLYEFEGRELFRRYSIPVTEYGVGGPVEEIRRLAEEFGGRVVVKAQVLVAGTGEAGGVRVAENPAQAAELAAEMLGSSIKGEGVQSVIVTPFTEIASELYLGFIVDRARRRPVMIASGEGGIDIEALAKTSPGNVLKLDVDPLTGLRDYRVRRAVGFMRLRDKVAEEAVKTLKSLYRLFTEMDCELAEINPLALTPEQRLVALDSKIIRRRQRTLPPQGVYAAELGVWFRGGGAASRVLRCGA
jgi:succinyl-CoA synthetase beta subunit